MSRIISKLEHTHAHTHKHKHTHTHTYTHITNRHTHTHTYIYIYIYIPIYLYIYIYIYISLIYGQMSICISLLGISTTGSLQSCMVDHSHIMADTASAFCKNYLIKYVQYHHDGVEITPSIIPFQTL